MFQRVPHLERPHCSVLDGIPYFMPAILGGGEGGSITWNGKKGSMLRLFNAYGRPATVTMVNQFAVPC